MPRTGCQINASVVMTTAPIRNQQQQQQQQPRKMREEIITRSRQCSLVLFSRPSSKTHRVINLAAITKKDSNVDNLSTMPLPLAGVRRLLIPSARWLARNTRRRRIDRRAAAECGRLQKLRVNNCTSILAVRSSVVRLIDCRPLACHANATQ